MRVHTHLHHTDRQTDRNTEAQTHTVACAHTCPAKIPHTPIMQRMLKTAEPTMVPTPTSP